MTANTDTPSLAAFESALARLIDALAQPKTEWTRDASIQRFEFTVELAWKSIMRFAQREGIECVSPRQAFRAAFKLGWVDDDQVWLAMLDDRNLTSHTYNETTAEELYTRLPSYRTGLSQLLERLKQLPDSLRADQSE
ncbi:MAG: HI0074 family nucleotidyltransferase substrate-binding subunit [Anaerolineales bacterium]